MWVKDGTHIIYNWIKIYPKNCIWHILQFDLKVADKKYVNMSNILLDERIRFSAQFKCQEIYYEQSGFWMYLIRGYSEE